MNKAIKILAILVDVVILSDASIDLYEKLKNRRGGTSQRGGATA